MPTWGGLLLELQQTAQILAQQIQAGLVPPTTSAFDLARRKYLGLLAQRTGRNVILYASKWPQCSPGIEPALITIAAEAVQGLMKAIHRLPPGGLHLVIPLPPRSAHPPAPLPT